MKKTLLVLGLSLFGACTFAKEVATGVGIGFGSSKNKITEKDFAQAIDGLGPQGQMVKKITELESNF